LNRGNARAEVFHKQCDYQAFLEMMAEASLRKPEKGISLNPDVRHVLRVDFDDWESLKSWPRVAGKEDGTSKPQNP